MYYRREYRPYSFCPTRFDAKRQYPDGGFDPRGGYQKYSRYSSGYQKRWNQRSTYVSSRYGRLQNSSYNRRPVYGPALVRKELGKMMLANAQQKKEVKSVSEKRVLHNQLVTVLDDNLCGIKAGTGPTERLSDTCHITGVSLHMAFETSHEHSQFIVIVYRDKENPDDNRPQLFQGISSDPNMDFLNKERYSIKVYKKVNVKGSAAAPNEAQSMTDDEEAPEIGVRYQNIWVKFGYPFKFNHSNTPVDYRWRLAVIAVSPHAPPVGSDDNGEPVAPVVGRVSCTSQLYWREP